MARTREREEISWTATNNTNKLTYTWGRQPESLDFTCVLSVQPTGRQAQEHQLPLLSVRSDVEVFLLIRHIREMR